MHFVGLHYITVIFNYAKAPEVGSIKSYSVQFCIFPCTVQLTCSTLTVEYIASRTFTCMAHIWTLCWICSYRYALQPNTAVSHILLCRYAIPSSVENVNWLTAWHCDGTGTHSTRCLHPPRLILLLYKNYLSMNVHKLLRSFHTPQWKIRDLLHPSWKKRFARLVRYLTVHCEADDFRTQQNIPVNIINR